MSRSAIPVRPDGQVIVTGSLAFDQIMVFPGSFKDHILPDKLHVINISFLVREMRKQRGGCAGNIAYTLALLGDDARIVAAAGNDFEDYAAWLSRRGVDLGGVKIFDDEMTASCHITTDQDDNQITGFFVGAMRRAGELSLRELMGDRPSICIVAPDDPGAMMRHCTEAREAGIPFLFDPSFQVTAMDGDQLSEASRGASILVVNDYEHAVFEKKTGKTGEAIFELVDMVIVTLGGEGSKILRPGRDEIRIPPAEISRLIDPTGAGDAYRAGFVAGLTRGFELEVCGRIGSVTSAYVVEQNGTQSHAYTLAEFEQRYAENFGPLPAKASRTEVAAGIPPG
ncbi:MAG: carbohydrate kinase family protein [bacterium]|nr:carbohydrate kinase family protein [bacterium]